MANFIFIENFKMYGIEFHLLGERHHYERIELTYKNLKQTDVLRVNRY